MRPRSVSKKAYSLRVYHEFLEYIADKVEAKLVKDTILFLARLNAWIIPVVQCFAEQEIGGGHRQKLYADICRANTNLALAQIVGQIRHFVELW